MLKCTFIVNLISIVICIVQKAEQVCNVIVDTKGPNVSIIGAISEVGIITLSKREVTIA